MLTKLSEKIEDLEFSVCCEQLLDSENTITLVMRRKIMDCNFNTAFSLSRTNLNLNKKQFERVKDVLSLYLSDMSFALDRYIKSKLEAK